MAKLIETRPPSGFRDYPPGLMIPREKVLETARRVYRSYGFTPIDTPAAESLDVLLGKGGDESDKLVYRVRGAKSEVEEMGLRFDLTVPFARFAARYVPELGTPFKRYAMGPVWRGERPGQGRFREFWQCDFDTIGTTSNAADIETVLVINDLFEALGFEKFEIRVNNRLILNGVLQSVGLENKTVPVLRALDKILKIGKQAVISEMEKDGIPPHAAVLVIMLTEQQGGGFEALDVLKSAFEYIATNPKLTALRESRANADVASHTIQLGIEKLRQLFQIAQDAGVPQNRIKLDLSIARGLDYYTGTIFETFLTDLPQIGSVCSGGRYDNLASLYTKQVLPGVGASLGVDRLLAAMEELKHPWLAGRNTPADVLVVQFPDCPRLGEYQKVARELRAAGVGVEVYPDAKKLKAQFEYADKRGFRLVLIAGPEEFEKGAYKVKDLAKRTEVTVPAAELVERVKGMLGG